MTDLVLYPIQHMNLPQSHGSSVILFGSKSPGGTCTLLTFPQAHCALTPISALMSPLSFFCA